jgi:hypothetical protein
MKKVRYLAGLAGLAPVAAAGGMTGTAAHAETAGGSPSRDASAVAKTVSLHHLTTRGVSPDLIFSCFDPDGGYYGHCNAPIIHGPVSVSKGHLYDGDRVEVSCYVTGRSTHGDIYYDRVIREHSLNHNVGPYYYSFFVPDYNISFSGLTPNSLPIRHC